MDVLSQLFTVVLACLGWLALPYVTRLVLGSQTEES
jgi:hypothetical protein